MSESNESQKPLDFDLRNRMAAALLRAAYRRGVNRLSNADGEFMADAVIEALEADYILVPKGHTHARIHAAREAAKASDFQGDDDTECDTTWVAPGEIAKMMGTEDTRREELAAMTAEAAADDMYQKVNRFTGRPCPFCPDNWDNLDILHRTGGTVIITPLNPVTDGHVLVITKKHTADASVDPEVAEQLMYVAAWYVQNTGIQANIITSIGANATQTVRHTHLHVIPRQPNDGLQLPWHRR